MTAAENAHDFPDRQRLEVVIVEDLDPSSPKMGGVAGYSRKLLKYLEKADIKSTLLGSGNGHSHPHKGKSAYIPIIRKPKFTGYEYLLRLLTKAPFLRIPGSAIIHAQHPEYMLPFVLFNRSNPKVVAIRGPVLKEIRFKRGRLVSYIYGKVEPFILKRSDIVLTVDEATRKFYLREYPWMENIRLIPTGVDLSKFKLLDRESLRRRYGFGPEDNIVIYVGRLEKEKGVDFLLEAFSLVEKSVPSSRLVIVGDGKERQALEELAIVTGLRGVVFMGSLGPDAVPEILNTADVLALSSVYEGSPTVVKEALACGVPVVSADVGDVRQIIRSEAVGMIVERDRLTYAQALVNYVSLADRETVRKVCAEAAAEFSFDNIGARTVALYGELACREKTGKRALL